MAGTWYDKGSSTNLDYPADFSLGCASSRPPSWKSESNESCGLASSNNSGLPQMLILATIFQCLDPVLTIAACLSSKPAFLSPMDKRDEATAYDYFRHSYMFEAEVRLQGARTICNREKRHSHRCPRVRRMRANPPRKVVQRHARLLLGSTSPSPLFPASLTQTSAT